MSSEKYPRRKPNILLIPFEPLDVGEISLTLLKFYVATKAFCDSVLGMKGLRVRYNTANKSMF